MDEDETRRVNPARAGMIRVVAERGLTVVGKPRACGDDPGAVVAVPEQGL